MFQNVVRRAGLAGRFTVSISLLLVAFCAVITWSTTSLQEAVITKRFEEKARSMASLLAATSPDFVNALDIRQLRLALADVLDQPEVVYAYVFDEQGRILSDGTAENRYRDTTLNDPIGRRSVAANAALVQYDARALDITQPIYLGRRRVGGIRLGLSTKQVEQETAAASKPEYQDRGRVRAPRDMHHADLDADRCAPDSTVDPSRGGRLLRASSTSPSMCGRTMSCRGWRIRSIGWPRI